MELPLTPSLDLSGKRALVTGAGRGLGLGSASALAQAGANVTLAARTFDEVKAAAGEIATRFKARTEAVSLDVTDIKQVSDYVEQSEPFDILVNNAGTNRPATFTEVEPADFDRVMNLNLRAAFFTAQAIAQRLKNAGKPGSIINISSQMGHVGGANRSVYCASKWAMEGWTKAMAIDLARDGIRANTIGATFIETPMTKPFFENAAFKAEVLSKIKLGRLGRVEDIMGAVVFLASDASALITGSAIVIDGGWTAE